MPLDEHSKYLDIFSGNILNKINFTLSLSQKVIKEKKDYKIELAFINKISTFKGVNDNVIFSNSIHLNTGNAT